MRHSRNSCFFCILAVLLAAACTGGCFSCRYSFDLAVRRYTIQLPGGYETLDGTKLVFFSDLHTLETEYELKNLRKIIRTVNAEKPDLVFFGGDLLATGCLEKSSPPVRIIFHLSQLRSKYGVYAVTGNHDWGKKRGTAPVRELEQAGIRVLENSSCTVPGLCNIAGVQDGYGPEGPDPFAALENTDPELPVLALIHRPEYWDFFPDSVKLYFAGHTHGGQINLPFLRRKALQKIGELEYDGRFHQSSSGKMLFITSGIGTTHIPIRIFCPPEICVIEFKKTGNR